MRDKFIHKHPITEYILNFRIPRQQQKRRDSVYYAMLCYAMLRYGMDHVEVGVTSI